jgi:NAD(P)-dependent dehydrogenase (short-subunit alcohol dehydrogenase family)
MNIQNKTVLITGANRGIGRALVEEALKRRAKRVYAGTRSPFQHPDKRVTPLTLDVTSAEQIQRAVSKIDFLDILINNAGIAIYDAGKIHPSGLDRRAIGHNPNYLELEPVVGSASSKPASLE